MFGRATIRLGIGPRSSFTIIYDKFMMKRVLMYSLGLACRLQYSKRETFRIFVCLLAERVFCLVYAVGWVRLVKAESHYAILVADLVRKA